MKKADVLKRVSASGGIKGKLAARRIAATREFLALSDDDEITPAMLPKWIEGRPTGLHVGTNLSDADLRVIEKIVGPEVTTDSVLETFYSPRAKKKKSQDRRNRAAGDGAAWRVVERNRKGQRR